MNKPLSGRRWLVVLPALVLALAFCAGASAHAHVSPSVVFSQEGQVFTLAVPTEEEGATTTAIELTPPQGFSIDSFVDAPGWHREVASTGSGENAVITKVTWSGGHVPTGEATNFQFLGGTSGTGTYKFDVKQTYSSGKVVDWSGDESSEDPAPTIEVDSPSSGGTSPVAWIALVLGALGLLAGGAALLTGKGGRSLT